MRLRLSLALLAGLLVLSAVASGAALPFKATLKAPKANPVIDVKWWYTIKATDLKGRPIRATLTAVVVDPLGTVHPIDYGPTGPPNPGPAKPIRNRPFKGTFRDFITFPPESAVASQLGGLTLRWTVKAKIAGKTYTRVLKRVVKPQPA